MPDNSNPVGFPETLTPFSNLVPRVRCVSWVEDGILRVHYACCHAANLVIFDCETRDFRPGCGALHIVESAAQLVDHVFLEDPGGDLPGFVRQEIGDYLNCGLLELPGFAMPAALPTTTTS